MDIKRIVDSVRALRGRKYLFVSTGPGYVPRSAGLYRAPEMRGQTFNDGRNERKRERRAKVKLRKWMIRRFHLPASLMAKVPS